MRDLAKRISLVALLSLALTSCDTVSSIWKYICGGKIDYIRGAALMDDSSLWDPDRTDPSPDAIEERDWAFTALGGMNAARLAVKMDYFIDPEGKAKESGFAFLDRQLAMAQKHGLGVIIDMHVPPGGAVQDYRRTPEALAFWEDGSLGDRFVKGWGLIADRYARDERILAFELMNEPSGPPDDYWALMRRTLAAIREADPTHLVILQPDREWKVRKLADDNQAVSFHFYTPMRFTHQGVSDNPKFRDVSGVRYPGEAPDNDGKTSFYDAAALRADLSYAARVSLENCIPVIIGEFGVSTAADEASARRWISDVLQATDDLGLDGYVYWREIFKGSADLTRPGQATMATVDAGCYYSPARFFGIRPGLEAKDKAFDGGRFYRTFGRPAGAGEPCSQRTEGER